MNENKNTTSSTAGSVTRIPTPNNGMIPANAMITVSANGIVTSSSQLTPVTPTSNVTVTTTAAMTQPHPPITPQVMAHPGVPPSPIPQSVYIFSEAEKTIKNSDFLMQVIQQPLHAPTYLQHIYNPQQQLLMSAGNITLQPTAMSPSIQITPQMLAAAGKPILQGQSNYLPSATNQTLVIGQLGVLSSQPSLIPAPPHGKAVGDAQKVKPFGAECKYTLRQVMGQATALQPKSPILPHPQAGTAVSGSTVTATATVLNSSQFKQISQGTATIVSTPQLITSQAAMIASQAQLLNPIQALGPNYQGITWATPGGIQSPALLATTQNPIFIRGGQHQDMFLQSPPPQQQQAIQANPGVQISKPKQVRPAASVATQTTVTTSLVQTSQVPGLRPQVKHRSKTQVTRSSPALGHVAAHQKADAANQTKLSGAQVQQSTGSQTKTHSAEAKQQSVQKAHVEIQASVPIMPKLIAPAVTHRTDQEEQMDTTTEEVTPSAQTEKITESATQVNANRQVETHHHKAIAPKFDETRVSVASSGATTTTNATTTTTATLTVSETIKEKQPQKAIVKPHVLTHVIEGYVIQEGPEPFPVNRSSMLSDHISSNKRQSTELELEEMDESAKKKEKLDVELAKCEFCGKMNEKKKFKRSKRFCSNSCAKRYNVGCSKRIEILPAESNKSSKKHHGMKSRKGWRKSSSRSNVGGDEWQNGGESSPKEETTDSHSGAESSLSPTTPTSQKDMEIDNPESEPTPQMAPEKTLPKSPLKWTVPDVYEFIKALPGCTDYADEFRIQEIDGQALLLLKEDHLMTAMNMKLGPALKICARINSLKEEVSRQ